MVKKILIAIGVLFALLVAAAIIVPLVVDVDKYRPQIVSAVNEKINGKLELGKLSLSLWGQVKIDIAGLTLADQAGTQVVSVKDAHFHLPFSSILTGSPSLVFKMNNPTLNVVKNKAGKLNVMTLMKDSAEQKAQPQTGSQPMALPALAVNSKLNVDIRNALVNYKDMTSGLDTKIKDMNLVLHDISLGRPMDMEMWADFDTKMGTLVVRGPARFKGKAKPEVSGGQLSNLTLDAKLDLDALEILVPGAFEKTKQIPAHADLSMVANQKEAKIQQLNARFHNAELKASGTITNLGGGEGQSPVVNFGMKSNTIDLKPWNELIPSLKSYELGGTATIEAGANGPSEKLGYSAKITISALTAKAPNFKAQPRFDGVIHVVTDQIEKMTIAMKAPGNDLQIQGKLVSFSKPRADFDITSPGMDLDQLINFPPPGAKTGAGPAQGGGGSGDKASAEKSPGGAQAAKEDYDAMLAPLRENKMMREMIANLGVNIKFIKARDVRINDIVGKMSMRDLVATVDNFGMKVFGGTIKATATSDLKPKAPTYRLSTQVENFDLAQAVASQMQLFKNTVLGKAKFSMNAEGASFNPDPMMANLKAKGNMRVDNATFASIDVGKMTTEALNKAIDRVGQKVPGVAGKKIGGLPNKESRYEYISSDFSIAGNKFSAPNFVAKSEPKAGIDLNGDTNIGLKDYSLSARWEVVDTHNLTKAKDISVETAGTRVEHLLAEGNGPVKFPVNVGCTLSAPCYNYTDVPEHLAKVAVNNVTRAATGRAKAEVQKKAEDLIKKAPPAVQNPINNIGKKLFGR